MAAKDSGVTTAGGGGGVGGGRTGRFGLVIDYPFFLQQD